MKKIFFLFFLLFIFRFAFAQDYLVKKNGEEFYCKVKEVTVKEVIYTDTLTSIVRTINKSDVLFIRYRNGIKEMFNEEAKKEDTPVITYSNGLQLEGPIIDLGSNDYSINGRQYNFKQIKRLLLSANDPEINRLLIIAKVNSVFGNILAYSSIPVGYIGFALGVSSLGDDQGNPTDPGLAAAGVTLGALCLASNAANIVFKINKRKKIKEAIALYNKRVEDFSHSR